MVENGSLVSRSRVLLGTIEQRPKVVRDIVFTCVLLHNMLRTHQDRVDRAPTPANDIVTLRNEQLVSVPDDNHRNPSGEAKHQLDLVKEYFDHVGTLAG